MGQQAYKIARLNDEQIHRTLTELSREFGSFTVNFNVADTNVGEVKFPEVANTNYVATLENKSELISHFSGNVHGVVIAYYRGGAQGGVWEKSPIYDDLSVDTQGLDPSRVKIAARVIDLFKPVQIPRKSDPIELLDTQRALQEATFSRLELQLEKVFEQTIELRAQLEAQVQAKEEALEKAFAERQEKASREIEQQAKDVATREAALDERRKSIDESDNTFARRQIRDRMLSDVSARVQNFGLSNATVAARRPVAMGMAFLVVFLLFLLVWTGIEIMEARSNSPISLAKTFTSQVAKQSVAASSAASTPSTANIPDELLSAIRNSEQIGKSDIELILLWVRFSLLSLGFAATILFYIRWQNQWAISFASTEQSLQQFHIDVNRANWVVETCLEWRKETKSDIPSQLIESLTRGLFAGRENVTPVLHPADELASALMGSASKLSLNVGGNTVEIDKPSKIPKSIPSASTPEKKEA